MELVILVALLGWVLSAINNGTKKRTEQARRSAHASPGEAPIRRAPARPTEMDRPARPAQAYPTMEAASGSMAWGGTLMEGTHSLEGLEAAYGDPPDPTTGLDRSTEEAPHLAAHAAHVPGLDLTFDDAALVKSVIYSEILSRRRAGRVSR